MEQSSLYSGFAEMKIPIVIIRVLIKQFVENVEGILAEFYRFRHLCQITMIAKSRINEHLHIYSSALVEKKLLNFYFLKLSNFPSG